MPRTAAAGTSSRRCRQIPTYSQMLYFRDFGNQVLRFKLSDSFDHGEQYKTQSRFLRDTLSERKHLCSALGVF